ncbi:inositol-pentakisphosphate 2-kinase [Gautieria morchelliformis]|nr:inositol-pentakisphosphate 2-kinase [Gautieria morchelliformis]
MIADVTVTDPTRDWSYLSEGGSTIVFSYVGPSHPTYNGKVLRLRKLPRNSPQHAHTTPRGDSLEEADDPSIAFQDIVTSCLIPTAHLPVLHAVRVSFHWLKELAGVTEVHRPVTRAADSIDIYRRKAVLATDLVGRTGWAVEIKPKWGFLPSAEYLSQSTRQLKLQHCRFCMHAHFKRLNQNSVFSTYCPLDLYSGDENRVRKALRSLWEAWVESQGKSNNLRLFNEGEMVDPEDTRTLSRLLTKLDGSSRSNATTSDLLPLFINALLPLILSTSLFSILAHHQKTLDSLDIEGLSQLWSRLHPGVPLGHDEPEPTMVEWDAFIKTYLGGEDETLRYHMLAYLLSATFKDCSVILRPKYKDWAEGIEGSLTVIDLDLKSVSKMHTWETLDREIVQNFAEGAEERTLCQQ